MMKTEEILKREKILVFLYGVYKAHEMKGFFHDQIYLLNQASDCYKLDPLFNNIVRRYYNLFEE